MAVRDKENIVNLMCLFAFVMELVNTQLTDTAQTTVCSFDIFQLTTDCQTTTIHIYLPENFCKAAHRLLSENTSFDVSREINEWKTIVSQYVNCSEQGQSPHDLYINVPLHSHEKTSTILGDNLTFYIRLSIRRKWEKKYTNPCNIFSEKQIDLKGCNQKKISTITPSQSPASQSSSLPMILTLCVSIAILISVTLLILCRRYHAYRNPPESGNDEIVTNNNSSLSNLMPEQVQKTALYIAVPDCDSINNVENLLHLLRDCHINAVFYKEHEEINLNVSEWSHKKVKGCEVAIIHLTSSLLGLKDPDRQLESPDLQIVHSILLELHTQSKTCVTFCLNNSIREEVINLLLTQYAISINHSFNECRNLLLYINTL